MYKGYHKNNSAMIDFKSGDRTPKMSFKIDTGASKTILPMDLFRLFKPNSKLEDGNEIILQSATNHKFIGYEHKIAIILEGSNNVIMNVVFCDTQKRLLGLDSIRENFRSIKFGKNQFEITNI